MLSCLPEPPSSGISTGTALDDSRNRLFDISTEEDPAMRHCALKRYESGLRGSG